MKKITRHVNVRQTPQSQPILGSVQAPNHAGGFSFKIDRWKQLVRFLILSSEGGTYYVGEKELTIENAKTLIACIKEDGKRVVQTIVDISLQGRAYKNDPAIFALAVCCAQGDEETRKAAYQVITKVCRIGTHLFHFAQAIQDMSGKWGRGLRNGVSAFYEYRDAESLAMQLVKYRQRDGWTHKDILRLAHPSVSAAKNALLGWVVGKQVSLNEAPLQGTIIDAFEQVQKLKANKDDIKQAASLIVKYGLPREALPTELLKSKEIWEALLEDMPITAMIRNLGVMTANEVIKSNWDASTKKVVAKITDEEALRKGRVHPIAILFALKTYASGEGFRGNKTWDPVSKVSDALDEAFYMTFQNVEPTNQNWLLALDVSGSMGISTIHNSNLTAREASAAMALVTMRTEPNCDVVGFTCSGDGVFRSKNGRNKSMWGYTDSDGISRLNISPKQALEGVIQKISDLDFGGTDCALPILYAAQNDLKVDNFVIYTDNETWAGKIHPSQALREYRKQFNPDAKMIVVGMTGTSETIADPNDAGMLDVSGFDTATPQLITEFALGKI